MANTALTPQQTLIKFLKTDKNDLGIEKMHVDKDGVVVFRRSFFYRKGMDSGTFGHRIMDHIRTKQVDGHQLDGLRVDYLHHREDWKAYPGTSYFVAEFLVN